MFHSEVGMVGWGFEWVSGSWVGSGCTLNTSDPPEGLWVAWGSKDKISSQVSFDILQLEHLLLN